MEGKRVGKWTVIAPAGHDKHKMRLWLCRCGCGYERTFWTSYLNTGQPSACPDCRKSLRGTAEQELKDQLLGLKVGKYTVTKLAGYNKYGGRMWLCRCECGFERTFGTAYLSGNGKRKATQCPECLHKERELMNRTVSELPDRFWSRLVAQAVRRGISVTLTQEEARTLFQDHGCRCALTGEPLYFTRLRTNYSRYTTASLDRIDSEKPYEKGNVQWVHKDVNMMKGRLTQASFMRWCALVAGGPSQSLAF